MANVVRVHHTILAVLALVCGIVGITAPAFAPGLGLSATGTWSGELDVNGTAQTVTLQLHSREDGSILGYVLGGTSGRTITEGMQDGNELTFDLEIADPILANTLTLAATVTANSLDAEDETFQLEAVNPELLERSFLFAEIPMGGGDPGPPVELAVVQRKGSGEFVNGAFVGQDSCDLFACGGAVTSFTETIDGLGNESIAIDLKTGGGCPGEGSLQAVFDDTTKLYVGTFEFEYEEACSPPDSGDLIGAKTTRTTSRDAAEVLDTYDQLATGIESDNQIGPADVPISADYSHLGATRADRIAEFNADIDMPPPGDISVEFSRFRNLHTVEEPDALPLLGIGLFGVDFADHREDSGGVYRDVDTADGADELKFLNEEGSDWLIYGNQVTHDIPLAGYSIGAEHIIAPTDGDDIFVSIGPWGAHVGPHTGHLEGNAKADWFGLYAPTLADLDELGVGNGICEAGDTCGLHETNLRDRNVDYVAPAGPFEITDVRLDRIEPPGDYLEDEHWRVRGRVAYYTYDFVHLGEISPDLCAAMDDADYFDPCHDGVPMVSENLITGAPVVLEAGDTIARPQIVAVEVVGHDDFYTGNFGIPEAPYQQMEFFTRNEDTDRDESFYTWLAPALEDALADILEAEGLNSLAFRYDQVFLAERRWKAEMALSNQDFNDRDDYSTVFSALGGWWENPGGSCDGTQPACDQLFSIYPIHQELPFYDAALYEVGVSYLAIHAVNDGGTPTLYGEVVDPVDPDTVDPMADQLLILWRNFDETTETFQGISYRLDTAGRTLRIAWGPTNDDAMVAAGMTPPIPAVDAPCDDVSPTCHTHDQPES